MQFFLLKALQGERITLTILRDKLTWAKSTVLKDFEEMTRSYSIPVTPAINPNRAEQVYDVNGSEFAFYGLDYAEKLHGRRQDWFWVNEAMEVAKAHFDQLEMRTTKGGILDYNPYDDSHWVFELTRRPDAELIHSTFADNPFLPASITAKIRSYEPTPENIRNGTADEYMWQVYGLGNKARLQGVIYSNWETVEQIPEGAKLLGCGLDFGFANDPTAIVAVYRYDSALWVDELLYQTGLTNDELADRLKGWGVSEMVWADSAEPKSIEEIARRGIRIQGAEKGPDSVKFGIDLVKQFSLRVTSRSLNLENELRRYKWAQDRNGRALNVPIQGFDHALDALRYCVSSTLRQKYEVQLFYTAGELGF